MKPLFSRIVDGESTGEEENMVAGVKEDAGGDRDNGWIRSHPGTPSSTLGPRRIGG
jgi:hypothetical protein